jgi:hypothetical protein
MYKMSRNSLDWLFVCCANVPVPLMMAWKRSSGELSIVTATVSGLVALAFVNLTVIVSIRARNRRHGQATSRALIFGAVLLATASAAVMALAVFSIPAHNEYVDLAFSNLPLSQIHPERKALVVELIRRKAANSRDYDIAASQTKPLSPPLYSPESFSSKDAMADTMKQLKKATDSDFAYRTKQQDAEADFHKRMSEVDPQYLATFEGGLEQADEASMSKLEQQWFSATSALYAYAAAHQKDIEVRNGKLKFKTTVVQIEFNQRQELSKTLYAKFLERVQGALRDKQQQRARIIMPAGPSNVSP